MKRLNEDVLTIGDIILTTSNKLQSKVIRKFTKSDISHAMVYVDHCSVIDATGEGVHARNTQRLFFPEDCAIYALRLKQPLARPETDAVCNFVRGRIGTEYSMSEAAATALGGLNGWSAKQFCSRLVAQAFSSAGKALVPDPNFCSPEDLKNSQLLAELGGATVSITDHDIERWENDLDMTQVTRNVTNALLNGIRKKNKDIQNLNDVDSYLIDHPEDDAYYCELLNESGYLTLWQPEMRKHPWQYDVEALKATGWPEKQIETYCKRVLETADNGGKRYHLNKAGYLYLMSVYGLKSFYILSSLYEVLADLDMRRFQVAKRWLNAQDAQVTVPDPYVTPHSPEWFAALSAWNPYQAQMTRMFVERGGSVEVCSMCGDEPAPVYRIAEGIPPPGSVATVRLCDDCRQIRARKGENFVPFDR